MESPQGLGSLPELSFQTANWCKLRMQLSPSFPLGKERRQSTAEKHVAHCVLLIHLWLDERGLLCCFCFVQNRNCLWKSFLCNSLIFCRELQMNLIRSHSAGNGKLLSIFPFCAVDSRSITEPTAVSGVGKPLTPERSRMLLGLRINVLAKGYSGISLETLQQVIEAFNGKKMFTESWRKSFVVVMFMFSVFMFLYASFISNRFFKGWAQWVKLWVLFCCSLDLVVVRSQGSVLYKLMGRGFIEELGCEQKCQERLATKLISSRLSRKLLTEAGAEPG